MKRLDLAMSSVAMVALSTLLLSCTQAIAAEKGRIVVQLRNAGRAVYYKDPLSKIVSTIEIDKVQRAGQGGIRFMLHITNRSRQTIKIANPVEFTRFSLQDKDGRPLELPIIGSRFVKRRGNPDQMTLPYKLFKVSLNDRLLSKKEVERYGYELVPGAHLLISAAVDKVLKGWERSYTAPPPPPPSQIMAGEYKIQVTLLLNNSGVRHRSRFLRSSIIGVRLTKG